MNLSPEAIISICALLFTVLTAMASGIWVMAARMGRIDNRMTRVETLLDQSAEEDKRHDRNYEALESRVRHIEAQCNQCKLQNTGGRR